ncbi:hypothetical protein CEP53_005942 [Fusarium sp. AF-6]|nr:hypothetical protein CEP53_005942 [Fusarium sp. AF-6]
MANTAAHHAKSLLRIAGAAIHVMACPCPPTLINQWKGMWRTWQVGEFEVRFDLYEDTKYDSTKAKVKRSVQKLQKAVHRKP